MVLQPALATSEAKLLGPQQQARAAAWGLDAENIRIHQGPRAEGAAKRFGAKALTSGNVIVLAEKSTALLEHELAHVAQQTQAPRVPRVDRGVKDPAEKHAAAMVAHGAAPAFKGSVPAIQRQESDETQGNWWSRNITPRYERIKNSAYDGLIQHSRTQQQLIFQIARNKAAGLSEPGRGIALGAIDAWQVVTEVLFSLVLGVLGLVVGFAEGLAGVIKGLVMLLVTVLEMIGKFLYGFIDGGKAFDQRANQIVRNLKQLPDAIRGAAAGWKERFHEAPPERQSLMIGELTGELLALLATFGSSAANIGKLPRLPVRVPVMVNNFGVLAVATAKVNVAPVIATGVASGTGLMMTGAGEEGAVRRPVRVKVTKNWRPRDINDPRFRNGCEGIATQIQRLIGGKIHRIRSLDAVEMEAKGLRGRPAFLPAYRKKNWGWAHHEVVVKDGRVFDLFTGSDGLPIAEYKLLWEHADALSFGF